jgi:hypothetical protein
VQLDVNGVLTQAAGDADLSGAFASRPGTGEWSITLEQADGSYLQAFALEGGNYRLTSRAGEVQTDGREELNAQTAGKVLRQYLSGDAGWREAMDWKAPPSSEVTKALRDVFTDVSKGPEIESARPSATVQPGSRSSGMGGLVVLVLGGVILYGAITKGPAAVAEYFPQSGDPRLVVLVGTMGLFALLLGIASLITALRARSWPTTTAEITVSKIEESSSYISAGGSRSNSRVFNPKVEYRYAVDGENYTCAQIQLGVVWKSGEDWARKVAARYPVGTRVVIYYDPGKPGRAFLEYSFVAPVVGLGLAAVFFAFFAHLLGVL